MFGMEESSVKMKSLSSSLQKLQVTRESDPNNEINLQLPVRSGILKAPYGIQYPPVINHYESMKGSNCGPRTLPGKYVSSNIREASYEELEPLRYTLQCGCGCHKIYRYEASHIFKNLIGDISFQYSKLPTFNQHCGQQSCYRRSAFTLRATYYFPHWLLA